MKYKSIILIFLLIISLVLILIVSNKQTQAPINDLVDTGVVIDEQVHYSGVADDDFIQVTSPRPESQILSPLNITGRARGGWYFESSFPIVLTNWDGLIIAEGYTTAQGDWMTEDFVPFEASLPFEKPECFGGAEYCQYGSLILQRDNPSGLSEHDGAVEMRVRFDD